MEAIACCEQLFEPVSLEREYAECLAGVHGLPHGVGYAANRYGDSWLVESATEVNCEAGHSDGVAVLIDLAEPWYVDWLSWTASIACIDVIPAR